MDISHPLSFSVAYRDVALYKIEQHNICFRLGAGGFCEAGMSLNARRHGDGSKLGNKPDYHAFQGALESNDLIS